MKTVRTHEMNLGDIYLLLFILDMIRFEIYALHDDCFFTIRT